MPSGWKGSTRHSRLPSDWPITQPRILARDGYQCRVVRADTGALCLAAARQVDHITAGDDHRDSNLQAICDWHHGQKSGREGGLASGVVRRAKAAKKKPLHPGVLAEPAHAIKPPTESGPAPF